MNKALSLFTVILTIVAIGCKVNNADIKPQDNATAASDSYQPVSKGSYWKYHTTATVNHPVINATLTMTGVTTKLNGMVCYEYKYDSGAGIETGYYYHGSDMYLSIRSIPPSNFSLMPYLKDNVEIGQTWISPLEGTNRGVGRIVEKDITKSVNGKTFTNVIHTQHQFKFMQADGLYKTYQTNDFYIAKGVGIIETNNATPDGPEITTLQEYSIK